MKRSKATLAVAALMGSVLLGPIGCMGVLGPTVGAWMTVKGPIQGGTGTGTKTGEACARGWFGVVALGDASIEAAAKNGGITRVDSADFYARNRIVIGRFCTVVRGS